MLRTKCVSERECVDVCLYVKETVCVCVYYVDMCMSESVCVCVCVCDGERQREREKSTNTRTLLISHCMVLFIGIDHSYQYMHCIVSASQ